VVGGKKDRAHESLASIQWITPVGSLLMEANARLFGHLHYWKKHQFKNNDFFAFTSNPA